MAITRRQFLSRAGLVTAGGFLGPGMLGNPFIRKALADTIGDRYFVICNLNGGNDGLNTVTPMDNGTNAVHLRDAYQAARGTGGGGLRLPSASLLPIATDVPTGTQLGLHPGLSGLKNLYDIGKVAVVQNCGYPEPNLSHEESSRKWETGDPGGTGQGTGWMGRYLAANYASDDIPAVNIGGTVAGEFSQSATSVLTFWSLGGFGFPYDYYAYGDEAAHDAAFAALYNSAKNGTLPIHSYIGNSGNSAFNATQTYPQLEDDYATDRSSWAAQYESYDTWLAYQMREVAKVIYGVENEKVDSRFFQVSIGGFDTHADQGGTTGSHADLMTEIGDAMELFYNDCADMGVANKLCVVIWSEFSRRIEQNSNGTDHGSQGPMFVIGGAVNGGVYGNHGDIRNAALSDEGNTVYSQNPMDPFRSTDIRDVYGTLLKHWLGMANPLSVLAVDGGAPNDYWTVPNFDLGFLP